MTSEGRAVETDLRKGGIVVTRGEGVDGPLSRLLEANGARVLHWGTIEFADPEDPTPLERGLADLAGYHWICFTSPRAVDAVVRRRDHLPNGVRVAAIGPSTGAALRKAGWPVHRIPEDASASGLIRAFRVAGDASGARVFLPASAIARDELPMGLVALGAEVHRVVAYRTVHPALDVAACRRAIDGGDVSVVTFTSPSAMKGLKSGLGDELFLRLARNISAAAIGETTASALRQAGWERVVVAQEATLEGLAGAAVHAPGFRGPEKE